MTVERSIIIEGKEYPLTLSDEPKTLLAAKAAGRVVVGIGGSTDSSSWLPVDYVVSGFPVDEAWLGGVARRELGIPWKIAETPRLIIREFSPDDAAFIPFDDDDSPDESILKDPEKLRAYIREQYAFFDCGMWAVIRKEDKKIVGMVSLTPDAKLEELLNTPSSAPEVPDSIPEAVYEFSAPGVCALGYHIYSPYRRRGYAREACEGLIDLLSQRQIMVSAYTSPENTASTALLSSLNFVKVGALSNCFLHPYSV